MFNLTPQDPNKSEQKLLCFSIIHNYHFQVINPKNLQFQSHIIQIHRKKKSLSQNPNKKSH